MKTALKLRLSVLILFALFVCRNALATDAIVSADASVNTAHPNTSFGGLSNLYVGNGNTAFLQFDLSSLPAGTTAAQIGERPCRGDRGCRANLGHRCYRSG